MCHNPNVTNVFCSFASVSNVTAPKEHLMKGGIVFSKVRSSEVQTMSPADLCSYHTSLKLSKSSSLELLDDKM